ncbi:PQQ-binding-like beta-propeller repeat protein [Streptomyces sp. NPDC092046]|uniref:serine/threonine-protein kinase n=1 Tax=Streptomyces sp. NPDC092046 TaxID=3366009 RepID=UPI003808F38A
MGQVLGALREGAPRRIGPYEVLARLGAGGMGEVFLARLDASGEFFAVKTVRRDFAGDPAFRDRFRREIRVAGLVRSAHAAAPVGGDADAEVPWLATAYVAGPSLSQAVRRSGPLPVPAVRALGARLARALADLHAAGVLHRDLKPGNVMLAVDGPRLIDFGIARAHGATTMTATGLMVGTPAFMSPEHVAGARKVTAASDVFCLGSLLCYAATGEDPFGDGPVAAVLYRVSQAEADLERLPEELREVVAACLSADPAARPTPEALVELLGGERQAPPWPVPVREHIGEYGTELAQLVAAGGPLLELPATAPVVTSGPPGLHFAPTVAPTGPTVAPAPPKRRRRALLAAAVALAVLGGGLGAYVLWPEPKGPRKPVAAGPKAPAAGPRVPGVDDQGLVDASGVVPQNAAQRPAGWKPWRAKLKAPAFGCSGNERVLVCRTTNGTFEALDPADGKRLWEARPNVKDAPQMSYVSPTGGVFIAQEAARPLVHDGLVVLAYGERVQVRDARTGAVRWEKDAWAQQGEGSRPVVADGMLFVAAPTEKGQENYTDHVSLYAYSLADGRRLWTKTLTNSDLARSDFRDFEPVAYAQGLLYALSDGGIIAYEAKTGAVRGQVDDDARTCEEIKVFGAYAYCVDVSHSDGTSTHAHLLDSATLASVKTLPASFTDQKPAVVTERTAVGLDGEKGGLRIFDPRDGKELGAYPAKAAPAGLSQAWSAPLLAGDQVVYADYASLYTVRLGKDGKPAGLKVTPVPGAPGPRVEEDGYDPNWGNTFDKMLRAPQALPVGGIAYLVYDKGDVASVALPR